MILRLLLRNIKASKLLCEYLTKSGFRVEVGIGGLETSFRATFGGQLKPSIAILAEYDALVGLGHACGHNLIAAAAVGAGSSVSWR